PASSARATCSTAPRRQTSLKGGTDTMLSRRASAAPRRHGQAWRTTPLGVLAVALAVIFVQLAEGQEIRRVYRIGHVSLMTSEGMRSYVQEFEKGLRDLGYIKGSTYVLEDRSADAKPELVEPAAAELVRLKVDVILTGTNMGVAAAQKATTTIPIVMVYGDQS